MDWNNTGKLLDKYYEGELTSKEEDMLKKDLSRDDLPQEWIVERDQILGMDFIKNQLRLSPDFDSEFAALIRADEKEDQPNRMLWVGGIAASIALFLSLLVFKPAVTQFKGNGVILSMKEIKATEKAINQTKLAFAMLSSELEAGTKPLRHLKALEKPKEMNHLKTLDQVRLDLSNQKQ